MLALPSRTQQWSTYFPQRTKNWPKMGENVLYRLSLCPGDLIITMVGTGRFSLYLGELVLIFCLALNVNGSVLRTQPYFYRRVRTMTGLIPTQPIKKYDGILLPTQPFSIFWTWWQHSFFLPWDWLKNLHQGKYLKMIYYISQWL